MTNLSGTKLGLAIYFAAIAKHGHYKGWKGVREILSSCNNKLHVLVVLMFRDYVRFFLEGRIM
jgi:hypothetical protein